MALVPFQTPNSSLPSSSSRHPPPQWTFDVFLSFRGEDTRDNFLSHLYDKLDRMGIRTFKDDKDLQRGEDISPELLKAIEESEFSIVVISKNYASSRWCLDELVRILECKKHKRQTVFPVFLRVDPSDVKKQTGDFGEGFDKLVSKHEMAKVQSWREALKEVGNISGWTFPNPNSTIGSESDLIQKLVQKICPKLHHACSRVNESLVAMNSHRNKVIELLGLEKDDCRVVGIWGMGGIGKTTIARAVYNHISRQFDGYSFVANVRAGSKDGGVTCLQQQLISDITGTDLKIRSIDSGKSMINMILPSRKVLIVLDDVDQSIQLENLLGEYDWLSYGSKVIITTRDHHVLSTCDKLHTYKVDELKKDDAVELLKLKAFSKNKQRGGYGNLLDRAAEYCKGVPLALEVLGSLLRGREEIHWKEILKSLEESPSPLPDVEKVLRISYDALGWREKQIFLDIACFFKGKNKNDVTRKLEGFNPILGISLLVEKSLITISYNKDTIEMHDLIQEMGQHIVLQESPNEPGERSRLWTYEDMKKVLMDNTGTKKVEGIVVEHDYPKDSGFLKQLQLNSKAFEKLTNLRILKICCFLLSRDLKYLSNNLRCLNWCGYPLKCLPSRFQPKNLVELCITNSKIKQLWMGTEVLDKLRIMDLSNSTNLTKCPDFRRVPNLESLNLEWCTGLVNLHPSIGSLRRLTFLKLRGCKNLVSLPSGTQLESLEILEASRCSKLKILGSFEHMKCLSEISLNEADIQELPLSIGYLTNLESMYLGFCENLRSIPNSIGQLKNLKWISLRCCRNLRSIPDSIGQLKALRWLYFSGCSKLHTLPEEVGDLHCLEELDVSDCGIRKFPSLICRLCSLETLNLSENDFESLPASINQLSRLRTINLSNCKKLRELPELSSSIDVIEAINCQSLTTIVLPSTCEKIRRLYFMNCFRLVEDKQSNILMDKFLSSLSQENAFDVDTFRLIKFIIPGSEIPTWFKHQSKGSLLCCQLPPLWFNTRFLGIALCFVGIEKDPFRDEDEDEHEDEKPLDTPPPGIKSENVGMAYLPRHYLLSKLSDVDRSYEAGIEFEVEWDCRKIDVKKCGIRLVYKEDEDDEDEDNNLVVLQRIEEDDDFIQKHVKRPKFDYAKMWSPNKLSSTWLCTFGSMIGPDMYAHLGRFNFKRTTPRTFNS